LDWLREMLVDLRVYFRSRDQLNDPNELRPSVVFDGTGEQQNRFIADLIERRHPEPLSPANRLRLQRQLVRSYKRNADQIARELHDVLNRVGVFCISESGTNSQLWSHYANGHRGVCVVLNPKMSPFVAAERVVYQATPSVINYVTDSTQTKVRKSLFTKGAAWAYEHEWRVIARWGDKGRIGLYIAQHDVPANNLQFLYSQDGPGPYRIEAGGIEGVVLGHSISNDDEARVRAIAADAASGIEIFRARLLSDDSMLIESVR
jgi:hypothetical protein